MSDRQPIADRPRVDRPRPERLRLPDRHGGPPGWDQYGPDTDTDLPPWAGPSVHATRPGGTRLRPPSPRADDHEQGEYADPWAGEEPPEWPEEGRVPRRRPSPTRRRVGAGPAGELPPRGCVSPGGASCAGPGSRS